MRTLFSLELLSLENQKVVLAGKSLSLEKLFILAFCTNILIFAGYYRLIIEIFIKNRIGISCNHYTEPILLITIFIFIFFC